MSLAGLIIIIGCVLFMLSVFMIIRWYRNKEKSEQFRKNIDNYKKLTGLTFIKKMKRYQLISIIGFSTLAFLLIILTPYHILPPNLTAEGIFILVIMAAMVLTNVLIIRKHWRCPSCKVKLSTIIRRGGAIPILSELCPNCGKKFSDM